MVPFRGIQQYNQVLKPFLVPTTMPQTALLYIPVSALRREQGCSAPVPLKRYIYITIRGIIKQIEKISLTSQSLMRLDSQPEKFVSG